MGVDRNYKITDFVEKPENAEQVRHLSLKTGLRGKFLCSMGIYFFEKETLYGLLSSSKQADFGREIIPAAIRDKDVLIVEDVVDTGFTLDYILKELQTFKPKTLKVCTLLNKPYRRKVEVPIDYIGYTMRKNHFVYGYGMDGYDKYGEKGRNLPGIF